MHLYPEFPVHHVCVPALISLVRAAQSLEQQARSRGCSDLGSGHCRQCVANYGTLKSSPSHPLLGPSHLLFLLRLLLRLLLQLDLSSNELCGLDWLGEGTYTAEGITAIAKALKVTASITSVR